MFLRYTETISNQISNLPPSLKFREECLDSGKVLLVLLAVLRPRSLESAQLGPRLCPEGVELGRRQQDVALVHPAGHQNALNQNLEVN